MSRQRVTLLSAMFLSPFYALAHGQELLLPLLIQLGSIIVFLIWIISAKFRTRDKLILATSYFVSLGLMLFLISDVPYRQNKTLLDFALTIPPAIIALITFTILRNKNMRGKKKLSIILILIAPFVSAQDNHDQPYIQNDSFVTNAFGFPATVQNFQKNYGSIVSISKKPIKNVHNNTVVDTIYTFSVGNTKIEIYKARHGDILKSAYIDTDKIPLKYNIKVGTSKVNVAKKLKAKIIADKVQVGDLEHGQVYTLTFSHGKLSTVSYEGYVD